MAGHNKVIGTSRQDLLETPKVSALFSKALRSDGPSSGRVPSREELGDERRHLNRSNTAAPTTYKHATGKPVQDVAQEQDSGARIIIIKVPRQDSSRPRRYGGLE